MAIKNATLRQTFGDTTYDIYPKTDAARVVYEDSTVQDKLKTILVTLENLSTGDASIDNKIKDATDELFDKIMGVTDGSDINDAFDTLKEVADYLIQHGSVVDGFTNDIKELKERVNELAPSSDLTSHINNTTIHVTAEEKQKIADSALNTDLLNHASNTDIHVSTTEKQKITDSALDSDLKEHTGNNDIHVTAEIKQQITDTSTTLNDHITDNDIHVSEEQKQKIADSALDSDLTKHTDNADIHVSPDQKQKIEDSALDSDLKEHTNNNDIHVNKELKQKITDSALNTDLTKHTDNADIHVSEKQKQKIEDSALDSDLKSHVNNDDIHVTADIKQQISDAADEANHENRETLDKLSTSDNGNLLFNDKEINEYTAGKGISITEGEISATNLWQGSKDDFDKISSKSDDTTYIVFDDDEATEGPSLVGGSVWEKVSNILVDIENVSINNIDVKIINALSFVRINLSFTTSKELLASKNYVIADLEKGYPLCPYTMIATANSTIVLVTVMTNGKIAVRSLTDNIPKGKKIEVTGVYCFR